MARQCVMKEHIACFFTQMGRKSTELENLLSKPKVGPNDFNNTHSPGTHKKSR